MDITAALTGFSYPVPTGATARPNPGDSVSPREAPVHGMSADTFRTLMNASEKKSEIASAAGKALSSPKLKAPEHSKEMVRQRIEEIKKRINIFRNLYANDPKGMAKALAQVFKDLRSAVKEYKAADQQELGMSGDLTAGALGMTDTASAAADEPAQKDSTAKTNADDTAEAAVAESDAGSEVTDPKAPVDDAEAAQAAPESDQTETTVSADTATTAAPTETVKDERASLYGQVEQSFRNTVGEDALAFTKEVKALVRYVEEKLLAPARIQMKAQKPDKETDKAFEDVDKSLKDLCKEMEDMDRDIKEAVPTAGMHLDIAA